MRYISPKEYFNASHKVYPAEREMRGASLGPWVRQTCSLQRSFGAINLFFANSALNRSESTGFSSDSTLAGDFISFSFGRTGRFSNPPPQLGQTLNKIVSTHSLQNVHSKVQIIASVLLGGNFLPQFSQTGLSSNIGNSFEF